MRRVWLWIMLTVLTILTITLSCSCGSSPKEKVVFVLFEFSGSTATDGDFYYQNFKRILSGIGPGDTIIADKITDNPMAQAEFPINEEFEKSSYWWNINPIFSKKRMGSVREGGLKKAKALLSNKPRKGEWSEYTDIFGSLYIAERVFKYHPSKEKVLVIMINPRKNVTTLLS